MVTRLGQFAWAARGRLLAGMLVVLLSACGCGEFWLNQTSSLGGSTAGGRGTVGVLFINNTDEHAVFTVGTYNPLDQDTEPDFRQLRIDAEDSVLLNGAFGASARLDCDRTFAIGSPALLSAIEQNIPAEQIDPDELVAGVAFFQQPPEDDEDFEPSLVGTSDALEALLGVDFPCNALLIIRYEYDLSGADEYRIEFELIPSESTR